MLRVRFTEGLPWTNALFGRLVQTRQAPCPRCTLGMAKGIVLIFSSTGPVERHPHRGKVMTPLPCHLVRGGVVHVTTGMATDIAKGLELAGPATIVVAGQGPVILPLTTQEPAESARHS